MSTDQALCRALSASSWDETAVEALSERYVMEDYEDPDNFIEAVCEDIGYKYNPHNTTPICDCDRCPWADRCNLYDCDDAEE